MLPDGVERDLWVDARGPDQRRGGPGRADRRRSAASSCPAWSTRTATSGSTSTAASTSASRSAQAIADRDAGALLLRDAGVPVDTRWIDDRDDLPRVIRAGRHIARTKRYIRNYGVEIEPADLVAEVEAQAARGDGWVKLVGDWIDRDAGDLTPCWPADVAAAAIARAHELGARVTAHCFGEQSVAELVAAGIDCIEHGTGLTDDVIAAMAEQGTALVPTRVQIDNFPTYADAGGGQVPGATPPTCATCTPAPTPRCGRPTRPGVAIYAGTDAGGVLPHGLIGREVLALHDAGRPAAPRRRWRRPPGRPATGSAGPAWTPATRPTSSSTTTTRGPTCARLLAAPARRVVLRGRCASA